MGAFAEMAEQCPDLGRFEFVDALATLFKPAELTQQFEHWFTTSRNGMRST